MGEGRGIALLAHGDESSPGAVGGFELGVSLGFRENTNRGAAAATRQRRQGSESSLGATELIDQGTEGGRSDILAADQPEPAPPLTIAQLDLSA
jgi:hypothetical protein